MPFTVNRMCVQHYYIFIHRLIIYQCMCHCKSALMCYLPLFCTFILSLTSVLPYTIYAHTSPYSLITITSLSLHTLFLPSHPLPTVPSSLTPPSSHTSLHSVSALISLFPSHVSPFLTPFPSSLTHSLSSHFSPHLLLTSNSFPHPPTLYAPHFPSHHYFPLHSSSPTPPLAQTLEHATCATAARREVMEIWNRGVKGNPHEVTPLPQTVWRPLPTLSLHCWRWETQTGRAVWLSGSSSSRTASAALVVHR